MNTINNNINDQFDKMRTGNKLSEQEKQKIAQLTKEGSIIKKEMQQEDKGKAALEVFNKTSRARSIYHSSKKQYDAIAAQLNYSKQRLIFFSKEALRIKNRLAVLKKLLKM